MSASDDCKGQVNLDRLTHRVILETNAGTLATVHAWLSLALLHPEAGLRPSVDIATRFAREILGACVAAGLFTPEALCRIANDEHTDPRALPESLFALRKGGRA
jgi:hypothetical protein